MLIPSAVQIAVWRAFLRVMTRICCSPTWRWWILIRLSSASARRGLMIWSGRSGSRMSATANLLPITAFDHGGEDTDRDVAFDAVFGPVERRLQTEEVFQHPESSLDVGEALVVTDHLDGGGLGGGERRGHDVTPGEEPLFVVERCLVVVLGESVRPHPAITSSTTPGENTFAYNPTDTTSARRRSDSGFTQPARGIHTNYTTVTLIERYCN